MPLHYSDEQINAAKRLQMEYLEEVTAAWIEVEEAQRRKTERVKGAEESRNRLLKREGIHPDDLGRLTLTTKTVKCPECGSHATVGVVKVLCTGCDWSTWTNNI